MPPPPSLCLVCLFAENSCLTGLASGGNIQHDRVKSLLPVDTVPNKKRSFDLGFFVVSFTCLHAGILSECLLVKQLRLSGNASGTKTTSPCLYSVEEL